MPSANSPDQPLEDCNRTDHPLSHPPARERPAARPNSESESHTHALCRETRHGQWHAPIALPSTDASIPIHPPTNPACSRAAGYKIESAPTPNPRCSDNHRLTAPQREIRIVPHKTPLPWPQNPKPPKRSPPKTRNHQGAAQRTPCNQATPPKTSISPVPSRNCSPDQPSAQESSTCVIKDLATQTVCLCLLTPLFVYFRLAEWPVINDPV